MNNKNYHPILNEPPVAHALDTWNEETRMLVYEYNGRPVISIHIPGKDEVGYRHGSDGSLQNTPYIQQIYIMLNHPVSAKITFLLSSDSINMRPNRAAPGQAIIGQVGRPLLPRVNGLYDITQDLLIDWHGCDWKWSEVRLEETPTGELLAQMEVELGPKPWFINLRMHYYRSHLGYSHHKPWKWRPSQKSVAGWCSWEAFRRDVTGKDIAEVAEFFSKRLCDCGFEYVQLDDGFEKMPMPFDSKGCLADGWLKPNAQFPEGHEGVVESVKKYGLKPGIWTNANVTNKEFATINSRSFIKGSDGELMLGEWIDYLVNCSPQTLEEMVEPYYKGLRELGYSYFKTDAIRHLLLDGLHEAVRQGLISNADAEARFRAFMECARKAIGDDSYFLASWGVMSEVVGLADACRISMDANPTWAGIRMQLVETARWFHTQRILFLNDPDHICARANFEWARSVMSLVSLTGELFMLSDPLETYDEDRLRLIRQSLPTLATMPAETGQLRLDYPAFTWTKLHGFAVPRENPVKAEGISIEDALNMAGTYPTMGDDHPHTSLWAIHIDLPWKRWCVVGRFATVPLAESSVSLEALSLSPDEEYLVFDFWAQRFLGRVAGGLRCKALEIGQCQVLSISPVLARPQVISSSRHVSMDAVSILSQQWEDGRLILHIAGAPGTTESYWLHIPEEYHLKGIDGGTAKIVEHRDLEVLRLDIGFQNKECAIVISFESIAANSRESQGAAQSQSTH